MKTLFGLVLVLAGLAGFGYGLWGILSDSTISQLQAAQLCEPSEKLEINRLPNDSGRDAGNVYACVDPQGDRRDVTERVIAGSSVWIDTGYIVGGSVVTLLGFGLLVLRAVQSDRARGLLDSPDG